MAEQLAPPPRSQGRWRLAAGWGMSASVFVVPWQAWLVVVLVAFLVHLTCEFFRHQERTTALQNTERSPVADVIAAFEDR